MFKRFIDRLKHFYNYIVFPEYRRGKLIKEVESAEEKLAKESMDFLYSNLGNTVSYNNRKAIVIGGALHSRNSAYHAINRLPYPVILSCIFPNQKNTFQITYDKTEFVCSVPDDFSETKMLLVEKYYLMKEDANIFKRKFSIYHDPWLPGEAIWLL